jgi:hypothetical protein
MSYFYYRNIRIKLLSSVENCFQKESREQFLHLHWDQNEVKVHVGDCEWSGSILERPT